MIETSYSIPPASVSSARRMLNTGLARVAAIARVVLPCIAPAIALIALTGLSWPRPVAGSQTRPGYDPQAAVERAVRERLQALADAAGLQRASLDVTALARGTPRSCAQPLQIEEQDTRHWTRMRFFAVCNDPAPWRLEFIVRGGVQADVVVAAQDLRAGVPITTDSLTIQRRELGSPDAATSDVTLVNGKASRRALRSGQVVNPQWLVEPLLVRRGASVDIVAKNPGIAVRVAGEALETGRRGEVIEVRNVANGRVIRARVIAAHTVEPAGEDGITSASPP